MIDLSFDRDLLVWTWTRPSGPALSAAHSLTDDIVIEADLADPRVITGMTAIDSDLAHRLIGACLGRDARPLLAERAGGSVELDAEAKAFRTSLGTWVVASDEAARAQFSEHPLVLAGWLIDVAEHALAISSQIDVDLFAELRPALHGAVRTAVSTPPLLEASEYLVRRLLRLADRLSVDEPDIAGLITALARCLGGPDGAPLGQGNLAVELGEGLDPWLIQATAHRQVGNVVIYVDSMLPGTLEPRLLARVTRPDGTLLALAQVRWTNLRSSGRAQIMVPDDEDIELTLTRSSDDVGLLAATTDPVSAVVDAALDPSPEVNAGLAGIDAVRKERVNQAVADDWAAVGTLWADLDDQDRAWLAIERAISLTREPHQRGSGDPAGRQRVDDNPSPENARTALMDRAAGLQVTWAGHRRDSSSTRSSEPFFGAQIAKLLREQSEQGD